ncbi:MAG: diaminopimelate epimerase [Bacillota bacterium]|nr:diaminopimelate epimerase [Bacillota bacterium]
MRFTKMHGLGNDYIYVNGFEEEVADPAQLARAMSDRHFGVGADGLVLILPSQKADLRMRIFNADGSEAQICGNALRCVGKYAYERGLVPRPALTVETLAGVREVVLLLDGGRVTGARVDMGAPRLRRREIPMVGPEDETAIEVEVPAGGRSFTVTAVSMGNPHAVVFVPAVEEVPLSQWGPLLEHHPFFPERTNVEFCQVINPTRLRVRVWERGSGETLACGSGACAVLVAAALTGRAERQAEVILPGGSLQIEWSGDGRVLMSGPATEVFQGEWPTSPTTGGRP